MRFALVIQEEYPGSFESYKYLTILHLQRTLHQFDELPMLSGFNVPSRPRS
jgi:hypothetical protein